jgi:hypothetical protein
MFAVSAKEEKMSDLIKENKEVRQRPDEGFRRWFCNSYFDIIFWFETEGGEMTGFQICYSRNSNEKAFTWMKDIKSHHFVSSRTTFEIPATAILKGDAGSLSESVLKKLRESRGELPEEYLDLILTKAVEYNNRKTV